MILSPSGPPAFLPEAPNLPGHARDLVVVGAAFGLDDPTKWKMHGHTMEEFNIAIGGGGE
jgi:hypothetical protein